MSMRVCVCTRFPPPSLPLLPPLRHASLCLCGCWGKTDLTGCRRCCTSDSRQLRLWTCVHTGSLFVSACVRAQVYLSDAYNM